MDSITNCSFFSAVVFGGYRYLLPGMKGMQRTEEKCLQIHKWKAADTSYYNWCGSVENRQRTIPYGSHSLNFCLALPVQDLVSAGWGGLQPARQRSASAHCCNGCKFLSERKK